MSTIHRSWAALGASAALSDDTARFNTVLSIATSRQGRTSKASPIHSRRVGFPAASRVLTDDIDPSAIWRYAGCQIAMVTALMITESLGGRGVLRERLADYAAVIDRTRTGLPYAALEALARRYAIPLPRILRVLGLPARPRARQRKEGQCWAAESTRLLRLARGAAGAEQTLGAADKAGQWLQKP